MITVVAGGVGAARFLRGLMAAVEPASINAVVNTGDDALINGLRVSPDLDTVTYTVAGAIDPDRGWGLSKFLKICCKLRVLNRPIQPPAPACAN